MFHDSIQMNPPQKSVHMRINELLNDIGAAASLSPLASAVFPCNYRALGVSAFEIYNEFVEFDSDTLVCRRSSSITVEFKELVQMSIR